MPVSIPRSMNCSARVSCSIVKSGMIWLMLSFSPQLIVDMNTGAWGCWFPAEEGKLTCEPFLCVLTSIQRYRLLGWNVYFCLFKKQWIRLCFSSQVFKFAFLGRQISTIWQYDRIVKDWQINEFWQIYSLFYCILFFGPNIFDGQIFFGFGDQIFLGDLIYYFGTKYI